MPDPCIDEPCDDTENCVPLPPNAYRCECARGFNLCNGHCVNQQDDAEHCGECDFACAPSLRCEFGRCEQPINQLILGHETTCALIGNPDAQRLKCWGDGAGDLYRRGSDMDSPLPLAIRDLGAVRAIALARAFRCVAPVERDVIRCWGYCGIECGALTLSGPAEEFRDTELPNVAHLAVIGLYNAFDTAALAKSTGGGPFPPIGATCGLQRNGVLSCVGHAALLPDLAYRGAFTPVLVGSETGRFRDVSGTTSNFCGALMDGGAVACWGLGNNWGQLGTVEPPEPAAVYVQLAQGGQLSNVGSTSTGWNRSCAVTEAGRVYCWGQNTYGMLGVGDDHQYIGAVEVPNLPNVTQVAVGGSHSCALTETGDLYCWGYAPAAGLGAQVGDMNGGLYFSTPQKLPGMQAVLDVRAGGAHTCVRLRTGAVMCWGANDQGQIGDNSFNTRDTPVLIDDLLP